MHKIEIAVAYHKDSEFITNECLLPIHVGKVCSDIELKMQGDDSGDNISHKNFGYAELTAIYWLWKNSYADIKGLFHYRRYLDLNCKSIHTSKNLYEYPISDNFSSSSFLNQLCINKENILNLMNRYSIVTRKKEDLRDWSQYTVRSHYAAEHHEEHLNAALEIIKKDIPEYYATALELADGHTSYFTNMFIMPTREFDSYCSWMFNILFKIESTLNLYDKSLAPNTKKARWAGFLGERLTAIYIQKQINDGKKVGEFPAVILTPQTSKKWYEYNTYDSNLYSKKNENYTAIKDDRYANIPIISVCIAAYNVEKYISKCIESIINQTLKNIEIICINDGSTDSTPVIINKFSNIDNRIIVINQQNSGPGAVRNRGIKESCGKYIHFMDGDDYLSPTFLEKMVNKAEKENSDIVISNHIGFEDGTDKELYRSTLPHTLYGKALNVSNCIDLLLVPCHLWDKIYKKSLIKDLTMPVQTTGEDVYFWYKVILKAKRVSILREPLHHYRINPTSVQSNPLYIVNLFKNYKDTLRFIIKENDEVKNHFYLFTEVLFAHVINRCRITLQKNSEFRKFFFDQTIQILKGSNHILPKEINIKKTWFYCNFDLIEKIRKCNSIGDFENIIGRAPKYPRLNILYLTIKKIIFKRKKSKYKTKINYYKHFLKK